MVKLTIPFGTFLNLRFYSNKNSYLSFISIWKDKKN